MCHLSGVFILIVTQRRHMAPWIWINNGSCNGLLSYDTKSLPEQCWLIISKIDWHSFEVTLQGISQPSITYSGGITATKTLPDIGGITFQDVGPLAAMEPGVYTMSDEPILHISYNIFFVFEWILIMRSGQHISHYTTAKLSVHVWNHDLIWWQNIIDTQKH